MESVSALKRIFLVSYPRSGSTLVRKYFSILQGRAQASVYADDVVDESSGAGLTRTADSIALVKSHQLPEGTEPIVYVVRDGRNAVLSFLYMKFLFGNHRFSGLHEVGDALRYIDAEEGSWPSHVRAAWSQRERRPILFLKYEDLVLRPAWFLQRILELAQTTVPSSVLEQCIRLEKKSDSYARNPYNGYLFQPQAGSIYDIIKRHRVEDYWRFVFDAPARRHFHEQGGTEFLLRFGYETSVDWWAG